jgi:hypothetical protein
MDMVFDPNGARLTRRTVKVRQMCATKKKRGSRVHINAISSDYLKQRGYDAFLACDLSNWTEIVRSEWGRTSTGRLALRI